MPYIPHTDAEIQQMLKSIHAGAITDLFDEIPDDLRCDRTSDDALAGIPAGMTEQQVQSKMLKQARKDGLNSCFAGAGAYDHHIPAAVWELTTRGEFYSAYTPYQAEASQGTLQLIYEFQSMIAGLTDMDVANASLYDGASALAEAILMAVRANRKIKQKRILIPDSVSPIYRQVSHTITHNQSIVLDSIPVDPHTGCIDKSALSLIEQPFAALVIPLPNFFGKLEDIHFLTNWAHQHNALVIGVINPMALGIFESPGNWGEQGADIVVGEAQPMGIPLASGGPYLGIMACKQGLVRQMPGRIIGQTEDLDGKRGFSLTLQAREQHIRRSKATSNICTNQGLLATAATIYMALMGSDGLHQTAMQCYANTLSLKQQLLSAAPALKEVFSGPHFHEFVIQLPIQSQLFISEMAKHQIVAGFDLGLLYPSLENCLLVCATEKRTEEEIADYAARAAEIIAANT